MTWRCWPHLFELHPLAAEDLTDFGQRPKIEDFGNLVYIVGYGLAGHVGEDPALDVTTLAVTEVHCFYAENFLVTVRHGTAVTRSRRCATRLSGEGPRAGR